MSEGAEVVTYDGGDGTIASSNATYERESFVAAPPKRHWCSARSELWLLREERSGGVRVRGKRPPNSSPVGSSSDGPAAGATRLSRRIAGLVRMSCSRL